MIVKRILIIFCSIFIFFSFSLAIQTEGMEGTNKYNGSEVKVYERTLENLRVYPQDVIRVAGRAWEPQLEIKNILSTPSVDKNEKIYDFANMFTKEEELELYSEIINFHEKTKFEIILVTVEDIFDKSYEVYADDFYRFNYFDYDGLLILINGTNGKIHVYTSTDRVYNYYQIDSWIYDLETNMYWGKSWFECIQILISQVQSSYKTPLSQEELYKYKQWENVKRLGRISIIIAIIDFIIILLMSRKHKTIKKSQHAYEYIKFKDIDIITTNFKKF